ncbi:MAG: winged helix-turn-helix domain-containing protein [Halobacteriales archaeon]|nr:winged helix-turn-helix domain-containing protein [Halobacteriales archaeon]
MLKQLGDPDSVQILQATNEEALSAKEISAATGLALSTSYRKLDLLQDAGLLAERIRVGSGGHHSSEYESQFQQLVVSIGANGEIVIQVTNRDEESAGSIRLEGIISHA